MVVANPNNYCGNCVYCRKNLPNECEHIEALGIDYDGAFAKYCRINSKVASGPPPQSEAQGHPSEQKTLPSQIQQLS